MSANVDGQGASIHPLAQILWRDVKGSGIAAFAVLMVLCIRCNQSYQGRALSDAGQRLAKPTYVKLSYDELQDLTGFHKATIGKAISWLENWGALTVTQEGRANVYHLKEVNANGKWRKLPQDVLMKGARFALKNLPRRHASLSALKVYFVLLFLFNAQYQTASVSYTRLVQLTGVRREDIADAIALLVTYGLVRPHFERDARHNPAGANDQSQRYWISGLSPLPVKVTADLSFAEDTSATTSR